MSLKWNEISQSLEEQLNEYIGKVEVDEVGKVLSIGDGVVIASGLSKVMMGELVIFSTGTKGMVFILDEFNVGIILLKEDCNIIQGTTIKRTHTIMSVPVGDQMLGRVIDSLGTSIDGLGKIESDMFSPIEKKAPGIMKRSKVNESLHTGINVLDALIPIGKGQRELIIGDRQTGKTSIAIDTILSQKGKKVKCIYVAIGQKDSTVKNIYSKLQSCGAMEYTTIVSSSASELSTLQYLCPYTGCTIAEYWLDKGEDCLIIYDDLSKHAVAYRTISLLFRRPPGREAYPGDIFYLHSRLLERSCRLSEEYRGGSITALPIVETQGGDISSYIPTNIISITDGQIFLQTDLFNSGQRPAVSVGLSVSRVGGDAQTNLIKKLSRSLKANLSQYLDIKSFSKFGSVVDERTKEILENGEKIQLLLRQNNTQIYSVAEEAFLLSLINKKHIKNIKINEIIDFSNKLTQWIKLNYEDLIIEIEKNPEYNDNIIEKIDSAIIKFMKIFYNKMEKETLNV